MTWFFLVAVAAGCEALVTHNRRDFRGIERFGPNWGFQDPEGNVFHFMPSR